MSKVFQEKQTFRMAWLDSFSVALSMLCGMASAVVCNLF